MAISKEHLASILNGKARELCAPENDNQRSFSNPSSSSYDSLTSQFDRMYLNEDTDNYAQAPAPQRSMSYTDDQVMNSRLPDAIKRSLMEKKIKTMDEGGSSILDELNIPAVPRAPRPQPQVQQPIQVASPGIDYGVIRAIVNECLKEYTSTQMLNESAGLKTITIKEGKISIIDNKGNIFSANLQKVGNVKDAK